MTLPELPGFAGDSSLLVVSVSSGGSCDFCPWAADGGVWPVEVIQGSKAGSMALGAALGRLLDEIPQKFLLATVLKGPAFRVPALIDEALDMVELEDWSRTAV